ncbi:hypothetical protein ACFOWB_10260 [Chenggangzhangella methanolivorans]|uniref:argonaute/piwi family protein n=1 Tax=Chenggangzhangella methanolivorans TaxID=1437009 RepID=UPI00360AA3B1
MKFPERTLLVEHFHEPVLEFASGQTTAHPKDGLFLYGPHDKAKKIQEVRIGVVGTPDGVKHFRAWSARMGAMIAVPPPGKGQKADRLHLANFPGIEPTFGVTFDPERASVLTLSLADIDRKSRLLNHNEAVSEVASLYVNRVRKHLKNDERAVDLWVIVIPEIVYERCRPESRRTGLPMQVGSFVKKRRTKEDLPLLAPVLDQSAESIFENAPDFHRHIKAQFLDIGPTQLVRETTIAPEAFLNKAGYPSRKTQDEATIAWNLATGLYYKTQPRPPWKLAQVRPGVCYIGMVYKALPSDPEGHSCCAAQMFLNEGDGVVFRGANGPWKTGDNDFHLKPAAAKELLKMVLETYQEDHGRPPDELFLHGQTYFNDEEWRAFVDVAPKGTNVVGVRIRTTSGETKLFRDGDYPVLRGTALLIDDRSAYLWTTGYVPQLDTYIGPETPNPLLIKTLRSKSAMPDIRTVLGDIMGLTKINYNSCNFNDGLPVTVRFARMVGDVLTMGAAKGAERQPFKFYI